MRRARARDGGWMARREGRHGADFQQVAQGTRAPGRRVLTRRAEGGRRRQGGGKASGSDLDLGSGRERIPLLRRRAGGGEVAEAEPRGLDGPGPVDAVGLDDVPDEGEHGDAAVLDLRVAQEANRRLLTLAPLVVLAEVHRVPAGCGGDGTRERGRPGGAPEARLPGGHRHRCGTHQKPTTGLSLLARATRSALVSMAGAAERAVVDTVVVGAIGAKDRADEASIMVLGRRRLGKDGARSGKLSGGERHRLQPVLRVQKRVLAWARRFYLFA